MAKNYSEFGTDTGQKFVKKLENQKNLDKTRMSHILQKVILKQG